MSDSSLPTISLWDCLRHTPESEAIALRIAAEIRCDEHARVWVLDPAQYAQVTPECIETYAGRDCQQVGPDVEVPETIASSAGQLVARGGVLLLHARGFSALAHTPVSFESRRLYAGEQAGLGSVETWLQDHGYRREYQVEAEGEWSRRGGVVDVWIPGNAWPIRLDFFGDEIERIRVFDPESQLSYATREDVHVPALVSAEHSSADFASLCRDAGIRTFGREQVVRAMCTEPGLEELKLAQQMLGPDTELAPAPVPSVGPPPLIRPYRMPAALAGAQKFPLEPRFLALKKLMAEGTSFWVSARSPRHVKGLKLLAEPYGLRIVTTQEMPTDLPGGDERPGILVWVGPALPSLVITDKLITFDESALVEGSGFLPRRIARKKASGLAVDELAPGDVVVHHDYGVGRFEGLVHRTVQGIENEFLKLVYDKGGSLFLPVDRIYLLEKLAAADEDTKLDALGSNRFARRKQKAREDALRYANELLQIEARQAIEEAPALPPPGAISAALSVSFPYDLTPDQDRAVEDIYRSMSSEHAMDRLLVGDVGFGKTEVAIRAVGYAVEHGYQAVLLAPTTILAFQHARLFAERMSPLGIKVEYVNRFRPASQNEEAMRKFGRGDVQVLIGTHRVLQRDFHAHKLGLIVIDEEHKFGVLQKEKLRALRGRAHRLAMSATPIPRSLNIALSGHRQISTITTPPPSRQSVETNVVPLDEDLHRKILQRELERDGQVYVVAPFIKDLDQIQNMIRSWAPEARIGIGHGRLSGEEMENLFLDFWEKRIDILVSTSIIESGLDVANANTMLIFNGHQFGMADLYQLRGRVGRSARKGYCYILVPFAEQLSPTARKRLDVIERFSKLGSGYQIAMYDLEIRGAGEILGKKQSGHVQNIGMGLYAQLLEEAIAEIQAQPIQHLPEPEIRSWFSTSIPTDLPLNDAQRIEIYRSLFAVSDQTDYEQRREIVRDRYYLPEEVLDALGYTAIARGYARHAGLSAIEWRQGELHISLHPEAPIDRAALVEQAPAMGLQLRPDALVLELPTVDKEAEPEAQIAIRARQWEMIQPALARLSQLAD